MSMTPYLEANALLAVIRGDLEAARAVLEQMLPGELSNLDDVCEQLASMARDERKAQKAAR